jgi:hypothetical protein
VNRDRRDDAIETADPVMHAPKSAQPHSRLGKKPVTAYVEKAAHKQLRSLGLDLEKSTQDMVIEALNDYFERHGLERLA